MGLPLIESPFIHYGAKLEKCSLFFLIYEKGGSVIKNGDERDLLGVGVRSGLGFLFGLFCCFFLKYLSYKLLGFVLVVKSSFCWCRFPAWQN
ncbi:hypothetical protein [Motilimonas eburnea]|uniref:hypothetical protein n=1 Tax=Motilimonas eburnea TaxID=1737488 RepID=UPI001E3C1ABE|nr:hypothetical protein [Motilimonas eburnea]MCE2570931.1 hypothetical protein [Motilimonas eburnea]